MARSATRRFVAAGAAALVVLVVVGVAGWWIFVRDDAPDEASIDDAQQTIEAEDSTDGAGETETDDAGASGVAVAGTWTIDGNVGSFDDFSSTYAGYRIQEELASIGANEAVGRTPEVTGSMTITEDQVTAGSFEVDMTSLQSDDDRRDNQLRGRGLETDRFPTGSFELTEPVVLPDDANSGDQIALSATGDLSLHGVTKRVTIDFEASLTNDVIAIVGQAPILLADYGIDPPEGFSVVSVAGEGVFEFQLFLSRS